MHTASLNHVVFSVLQLVLWSIRNNGLEKTLEDLYSIGLEKKLGWQEINSNIYSSMLKNVKDLSEKLAQV